MWRILAAHDGKKMTELWVLAASTCAGTAMGTARARLAPLGPGLASGGRLQQPQPLADGFFSRPVALPLEFDLQPGPLVGIESLQRGPGEFAIGRGLRREQGRIRPANRACGHLRPRGWHRRLRRFGPWGRRAAVERDNDEKRGCEAAHDPRRCPNSIRHRLVGPNLLTHIGARAADQAGRSWPQSLN